MNEDFLRPLSFKPYIEWARQNILYLHHKVKQDTAYDDAIRFASILSHKLVDQYNLSWDEYKSDSRTREFFELQENLQYFYKIKMSDKKKRELIDQFRKGMELSLLLIDIKNMPDPTIKD